MSSSLNHSFIALLTVAQCALISTPVDAAAWAVMLFSSLRQPQAIMLRRLRKV